MVFRLEDTIAAPMFSPKEWQSKAPDEFYLRAPVKRSADLTRIMALPKREPELDGTDRSEAIIDMITERYSLANENCTCEKLDPERHEAEGCIKRLRVIQAMALWEIGIVGGLGGPIGVGHGKTLLDLLAPLAFAYHARANNMPEPDELLCVLLVPPKLVEQLASDYDYIGQHFRMPSMIVQGSPHLDRIRPGMPKLQVMPYSRLMQKGATSWFNVVRPHAIIADECHKLRDRNTATTSRVLRYFDDNPHTRFACWSGSITSKSIKDYAHLFALGLKFGSPLPIDPEAVDDWARAIDPANKNPADPGPLLRGLIDSGCCKPGESLYTGMRRRISETIGVVTSTTPAVDCALELLERKAPAIPHKITELIDQALAFIRPDGEEFVTAMQAVACACELACGFHYKWIYPHNVFPRDTALVEDWFLKRQEFNKELRSKLKNRDEHLDSPQLCIYAAQRAYGDRPTHKGLPQWASKKYPAWRDIKGKVKPEGVAVRIDDFLVRDVIKWTQQHKGIVWFQHAAFGVWLAELSGLPLYGAGADAKRALKKERGEQSVLVSIPAHGTGTNGLQFNFHEQIFTAVPADTDKWEQTLGRLHRAGQRADVVRAWFYLHTNELRKHIRTALRNALYVEGTLPGGQQKLRMGFPLDLENELIDEDNDD